MFTDDGTYKVSFAARADKNSNGLVYAKIYPDGGSGSWLPWTLDVVDGTFRWYHNGVHIADVTEGFNCVCIGADEVLYVDAVLVRRI